jgi:hypothetical protein
LIYIDIDQERYKILNSLLPRSCKGSGTASLKQPLHRPMARAKTPRAPAALATMAPVGAGAPPVDDEVDFALALALVLEEALAAEI